MTAVDTAREGADRETAEPTRPFAPFEWMIAGRYLRSRRRETFISVIAGFSFAGIMLGVATLIIVMAVMNGFRQELLGKILGLNGHVLVQPLESPLTDYKAVAARIAPVGQVEVLHVQEDLLVPVVELGEVLGVPAQGVGDLPERRAHPGRRPGEGRREVGEEPRAPKAPPADDDPVERRAHHGVGEQAPAEVGRLRNPEPIASEAEGCCLGRPDIGPRTFDDQARCFKRCARRITTSPEVRALPKRLFNLNQHIGSLQADVLQLIIRQAGQFAPASGNGHPLQNQPHQAPARERDSWLVCAAGCED